LLSAKRVDDDDCPTFLPVKAAADDTRERIATDFILIAKIEWSQKWLQGVLTSYRNICLTGNPTNLARL
jgi:hypothetical protein